MTIALRQRHTQGLRDPSYVWGARQREPRQHVKGCFGSASPTNASLFGSRPRFPEAVLSALTSRAISAA